MNTSKHKGNAFPSLGKRLEQCRANLPMAVLDKEMKVVWANSFFCQQIGLSREFILGRSIAELKITCSHINVGVYLDKVVMKSNNTSQAMRPNTKTAKWTKVNIIPSAHDQESQDTYLLIKVDETIDIQEAESYVTLQQALHNAARYRFLLDHQPDMISLCDRFGCRTFVNSSYCKFAGKSEVELIGTNIRDVRLLGLPLEVIDKVFLLTPENPEMHGIYPLQNAAHEIVWMYGRSRGIFDANGNLQEILNIGRDVTTLKNAELDKVSYIEDLERIAFMTSHKIRAPIATMMGLLELLRLKGINSDQWNPFFESFRKCIQDLDYRSKEMAAFIYARQSI